MTLCLPSWWYLNEEKEHVSAEHLVFLAFVKRRQGRKEEEGRRRRGREEGRGREEERGE
jgi:hypothetical protein